MDRSDKLGRSQLEIRAGILDGLRDPERPIGLVFKTGLSLRSLRTHLEPIVEDGLVEEGRDRRRKTVYTLTSRGAEALSRMYRRYKLDEEKKRRQRAAQRSYATVFILCALLAIDTAYITIGLLRYERTIPGTGKVVVPPPPPPPPVISFDLCWDEACTQAVMDIDWGTLEPGGSKTVSFYVKNDGEVSVTMEMNTTDWMPASAEQYMTVTWDGDGAVVQVGDLLLTNMELVVSPQIKGVDSFSFTIIVAGTES